MKYEMKYGINCGNFGHTTYKTKNQLQGHTSCSCGGRIKLVKARGKWFKCDEDPIHEFTRNRLKSGSYTWWDLIESAIGDELWISGIEVIR